MRALARMQELDQPSRIDDRLIRQYHYRGQALESILPNPTRILGHVEKLLKTTYIYPMWL